MFGKIHSADTKTKISAAIGIAVEIIDLETNEISVFSSMNKAAEMLGVTKQTISQRFKKTDCFLFKGRYQVKKNSWRLAFGPASLPNFKG